MYNKDDKLYVEWKDIENYVNELSIQVCRDLPENSDREIANLMEIKDHYHKYVVCKDNLAKGNENGIEIIHITDFLLKEIW